MRRLRLVIDRRPSGLSLSLRRGRVAPRGGSLRPLVALNVVLITVFVAAVMLIEPAPYGAASGTAGAGDIVGRASVVDGDTIAMQGQRIRFDGIDAPERMQTCGDDSGRRYDCGYNATRALAQKIAGETVNCEQRGTDRYGRIVGICRVGDVDLNAWMVREGWAVAYLRYSLSYLPAEIEARLARRGIWAGDFISPEDYRQGRRQAPAPDRH